MGGLILEPRVLHWLEGLRLSPRKKFGGSVRGERVTQAKGISIEFADYREYAEGDDLRHLDWNILARLGHAVTKTYRDEEDLAVHILLDASASMDFGSPTKLESASQIAAAIGYVALTGGDTVYPRWLSGPALSVRGLRGRASYPRLSAWAQTAAPTGTKSLDLELRSFASSSARTGVVVIVTDALQNGLVSALRAVSARRHEIWLIQVLSAVELDPDLEGDLRLLDAETSGTAEVTINSFTLKEYRRNLEVHNRALFEECQRSGGRYALVQAGTPLDQIVKNVWKRERWVE